MGMEEEIAVMVKDKVQEENMVREEVAMEELTTKVEGWGEVDLVTGTKVVMINLFQVMCWSHSHLFRYC